MKHERYHNQKDEAGEPTGLGYLSCLILRNVARTVKLALTSSGTSVDSLTGGEPSIFEAFARAEEGGIKKDPILISLEKVDYTGAKKGASALLGLEAKLVETTYMDHGLGQILGEVLQVGRSLLSSSGNQLIDVS